VNIICDNEQHKNNIDSLIEIASSIFDIADSEDLTIITTHKFKEDFLKYSSEFDKCLIQQSELPDLNGALILPRDEVKEFRIILNTRQFETNDYIHTFFHEVVHYLDYKYYFSKFGNVYGMSEDKRDELYFYEYSYWSEYHAKKIGITLLYYKTMLDEHGGILDDWKNIIQVGFQSNTLSAKTKKLDPLKRIISGNEMNEYFNFLFGYYGRASIFQNENSTHIPIEDFPESLLLTIFGKAIIDLYYFLIKNNEYDSIVSNLYKLKGLLKEICLFIDKNKIA